jgi:hypothetical protein
MRQPHDPRSRSLIENATAPSAIAGECGRECDLDVADDAFRSADRRRRTTISRLQTAPDRGQIAGHVSHAIAFVSAHFYE